MNKILLYPTYFPSIAYMAAILAADTVVFEVHDNYQKQTFRNRTYIAHSNGKLLLNVPIKHSKGTIRQKTRDVIVENNFPWQAQHWKSLQSAYRTSPFFEFYEDDLEPLFTKPVSGLLAHNLEIISLVCELLGIEFSYAQTDAFEPTPAYTDLRSLADVKMQAGLQLNPYIQVLGANHGFISNLSILDLLFNEGPNATSYLEAVDLSRLV